MKKIVFFNLILFTIIFSFTIGIVSAGYSSTQEQVNLHISKGWNIIPASSLELQNSDSPIKQTDFRYGFILNPLTKQYINVIKDYKRVDGEHNSYNWATGEWLASSSIWIYTEKTGDFIFKWDSSVNKFNSVPLKKGWNFIYYTIVYCSTLYRVYRFNFCNRFNSSHFLNNPIPKIFIFTQKPHKIQMSTR